MFTFESLYTTLPESLWSFSESTPVMAPRVIAFNRSLAQQLGAQSLPAEAQLAEWFSGQQTMPASTPIALAYAGHQFGQFVPRLGDGRALLLGEVIDRQGKRCDIQLKGSGRTPYSRGGDGRSPLGPVLREYLVSEAMAAMGIATTRALAAVATGERVMRGMLEPGAVLTRVASSHVRVGTFQYAAARDDQAALSALVDHVIQRHYPAAGEAETPVLALLDEVVRRQARLVAQWMGVGFIHGVMNTDNTSISGETIDYGPCAFMEQYHPLQVYSSIDQGARYAFSNQPRMARWNLARFAECLLPLLEGSDDQRIAQASEVLERFDGYHQAERTCINANKLGLATADDQADQLMAALEARMQEGSMDMQQTFAELTRLALDPSQAQRDAVLALSRAPEALGHWLTAWQGRQVAEQDANRRHAMVGANPVIIPRNHRVEEAIAAAKDGDEGPFHALLAAVTAPFVDNARARELSAPASEQEQVLRTFCGT